MSSSEKPKRTYTSTHRREQANQTRRAIVEAARVLFEERGYAATTIDAIAQQAGVAPETIYAAFGSKSSILRRLFSLSLVGDEQPTPLLERPHVQENIRETDPKRMIENFARDIYQIMRRVSPLFALLRATAKADPEIDAMLQHILAERLKGMRLLTASLSRLGALRDGVDAEQAAVTVWAISSAEVFILLTHDQGWDEQQYIGWLIATLESVLLP